VSPIPSRLLEHRRKGRSMNKLKVRIALEQNLFPEADGKLTYTVVGLVNTVEFQMFQILTAREIEDLLAAPRAKNGNLTIKVTPRERK